MIGSDQMGELKIVNDNIAHAYDNSDDSMRRIHITFKNGHTLSIIRGSYSFGGPEGLFEIMPDDSSLFDDEDTGDEVLGYLSIERLNYYIEKIGSAK